MRSPFKTIAVALVLALTTATLADASTETAATPATTMVAPGKSAGATVVKTTAVQSKTAARRGTMAGGKSIVGSKSIVGGKATTDRRTTVRKATVLGRHHARLAARFARHGRIAHRPLRNKIVQEVGVRHLAQNHRTIAAPGVVR